MNEGDLPDFFVLACALALGLIVISHTQNWLLGICIAALAYSIPSLVLEWIIINKYERIILVNVSKVAFVLLIVCLVVSLILTGVVSYLFVIGAFVSYIALILLANSSNRKKNSRSI